jgi:protease secretion system outer membrane protein
LNRESNDDVVEDDEALVGEWVEQNHDVILARLNQKLAELEISRAKSAWLPELNASYTYTSLSGESDTFIGLSLTMPIRASKVYGLSSAKYNFTRMKEDAQDKKRQVKLEIQRLMSTVKSGLTELETRREAIEAAKLSVTANEKSYKGGVRSILDVLASIDALYSIEGEYVEAALALGENFLNLRLQQGQNVIKSLRDVEQIILSSGY